MAALFLATACAMNTWGLVGIMRDDGIYLLGARALRQGLGYVDLSLPGLPGVLRYPPLHSAILALMTLGSRGVADEVVRAQWLAPLSGVAFVLLSYHFLRRYGRLETYWAVLASVWTASAPSMVMCAARLMADVPFAAMGVGAACAFEAAMASATVGTFGWLAVGLGFGACLLLRYAAVAMVAAAGLVLANERRWRALAAFLAGIGLLLLPWLVMRQHLGGSDYVETLHNTLPHDIGGLVKAVGIVLGGLFGNALPGMLYGAWFLSLGLLNFTPFWFLVGVAISTVVLVGLLAGLVRPARGRSLFVEVYVACTLLVSCGYGLGFSFYADNFLQRAFIPIIPFLVLLMLQGVNTLSAWLPKRGQVLVLALATLVGIANNALGTLTYLVDFPPSIAMTHQYERLFEQVRKQTPPDARLIAYEGHMVTLYTERKCETFSTLIMGPGQAPITLPPGYLIGTLVRGNIHYIVGTPDYGWTTKYDRTIRMVNTLNAFAPGLLITRYMSPTKNFALFEIDPKVLAQAVAYLKAHPPPKK